MLIVTGTIIVMILANVSPVERRWPEGSGSWESKPVYSPWPGNVENAGFVHDKCEFGSGAYEVVVPPKTDWHEHDEWAATTPTPVLSDEEIGPDYDDIVPEPPYPRDDPNLEDEFPKTTDDEGVEKEETEDDPALHDNGLARFEPTDQEDGEYLAGWQDSNGPPGVVRDVPSTEKALPRRPFARMSKMPASFVVWNESVKAFQVHDFLTAHAKLQEAGFFGPSGRPKPLVLFAHGWHALADDRNYWLGGMRLHSRAVPDAAALYLDWDQQGALRTPANATVTAWRVNITNFINDLDPATELHCVGHSIGTFACSAVCRQFYVKFNRRCERIVGINPYDILETEPDLTQRVRDRSYRRDAEYVVVVSTGTRGMDPGEDEADEYIVYNNLAASSEVCLSEKDWETVACAGVSPESRFCETLGVHNITFRVYPTDMKRMCTSMLAPVFFFSALDARGGGVPLIRVNPMATSTIVGSLPSVWDARVYGKDYRYSTYVRNESVWYSAHMVQSDRTVTPVKVFTIVVPYVSSVRVVGAFYTAKTRYHNISVYSAFVTGDGWNVKPDEVRVYTSGPVLSAYMWSGAGVANLSIVEGDAIPVPVTAQNFTQFECAESGPLYVCLRTDVVSQVPVPRSRLPVQNVSLPVPAGTCIPYSPPNVTLVVWKRKGLDVRVGINVTLTYSHSRQLLAVVLENHEKPSNTTLLTFYDSCETAAEAGVYYEYDWSKGSMNMAFLNSGRYTMRLFYLFEALEVPVRVLEKPAATEPALSWPRLVRT